MEHIGKEKKPNPNKNNEFEEMSSLSENSKKNEMIQENNIIKLRQEYQNNDIKAIIRLAGTNFEKILVQSSDNNYYLRKNLKGAYDIMGVPFIDYRSTIGESRKNILC